MSDPSLPRLKSSQISVVMPVYNARRYLDAAIESILVQTLPDFEFVILDDASTDGSTERLREWASKDKRIRLHESKRNLGPALSSQRVARAASAAVVARMDADDVSSPDRLREQFDVLRANPEAGIVASLCDIVDARGRKIRGPELWRLVRSSWSVPFAHGAMMYRKDVFDQVGGYRQGCDFWEDQDLVTRMAAVSKVLVIPRALYRVRQSATSTRSSSGQLRQENALDVMYRSIDKLDQGQACGELGPAAADTKVDPRVFISIGSVTLWTGGRPRLFRRLLRRARLGLDYRSLSAIVWTAWASAAPGMLRQFLLLLLAARNALAAPQIDLDAPVPWSQPKRGAVRRGQPVSKSLR